MPVAGQQQEGRTDLSIGKNYEYSSKEPPSMKGSNKEAPMAVQSTQAARGKGIPSSEKGARMSSTDWPPCESVFPAASRASIGSASTHTHSIEGSEAAGAGAVIQETGSTSLTVGH